MRSIFYSIGQYFLLMQKVFKRPDKQRIFWNQTFKEIEKLGLSSVTLVSIISFFIGAVITIQMAINVENPMVPKSLAGLMTRDTMLLEFCSTIIAIILAGKVGSYIASEIGSMRISEQIDAMEMMGVNSANFLILPKVVASVLFNPCLTIISALMGIFGGAFIASTTNVVAIGDYVEGLQMSFQPYYISYSLIKMFFFSLIISTIPGYFGYYAKGGAIGVGKSSTQAIVASTMLILIFNLILTNLLLQ